MRFVHPPKSSVGLVTSKSYLNAKGRRTHHARKADIPVRFVGVDGEGITLPDGEHRYVLLGVGEHQISDGAGLDWERCFSFLYEHYTPGTCYAGFFLGYDFTQMFRSLPESRSRLLLTREERALRRHVIPGKPPHPVQCGKWQFDILGNKRLRIRPKTCGCLEATCQCNGKKPWMYICDTGPFFQSSFLTVIDPKNWAEGTAVVTPEEYEIVKAGKENRSVAVLDDTMRTYNRLENDILARVLQTVSSGFTDIGVRLPPSKWFGPGQASQQWMSNHDVPKRTVIQGHVPRY